MAEAVRFARQHSPVLASARADADAARATAGVARAAVVPQISANGFATAGNHSVILTSPPASDPQAVMGMPSGTIFDGNLMLMAPILSPRLQAQSSASNAQSRAALGDLQETQADVTLQVTEAYDHALLGNENIAAAQAKIDAAQAMVDKTQVQVQAGDVVPATLQRAQAELAQAQRSLASAKNDKAKAILDLQAAMGADLSVSLEPSDSLAANATTPNLDELISTGKKQRGMVISANARVAAANADVHAAENERAPTLFGVAMGDAANRRELSGLSGGLLVSLPIFEGGRINAEISKAKANRTKAEAQLKQAELTVEKEVRQAWLDLQTAHANASSAQASVTAAESSYDITAQRVQAGRAILVEQLDALQALTQARADLAQAHFDEALASARLQRAAGVLP